MYVRVGLWRKLNAEELMLLNCGVGEDFESPLDCKEIKPVNPKGNQSWIFSLEGQVLKLKFQYFGHLMQIIDSLKRPYCWERLEAGGGDSRGWGGWMASPTWWTWVWASSGSWWWTGKPGMLQLMRSQRVGREWATELNWMNTSLLGPSSIVWEYHRQHITSDHGCVPIKLYWQKQFAGWICSGLYSLSTSEL